MSIKLKYLIPLILIGFLIIPQPAFAFVGAFFEFLDHLTEAVEEFITPMAAFLIVSVLMYVAGIISLVISSWILQLSIEKQTIWISSLNPMTELGWNFTAGLANMILVLIFLIIAFAFILKIETFQAKKALPRLIIVALLINFSWLFVKMLIDLTQIVYQTILNAGGGNLLWTTLEPFFGNIVTTVQNILTWVAALIVSLTIPVGSAFSALAFAIGFPALFLPNIIVWVFQTFCFSTISSMFLIYAVLFAGRVFVLQILAILSPIAFLALILPQTRSHWDDWLKHLISWLLLGVFLLFFLVLGFKGLGYLVPEGIFGLLESPIPIPGIAWFELGKYIFYYFAIFVYLAMVIYINKKYLPAFASELLEFGKQATGFMITRGIKPFHKAMHTETAQRLARWEGAQKWAQRLATAPPPTGVKRLGWAVKREVGKAVGPDVKEFQLRRRHEAREKWRGKGTAAQSAAQRAAPFTDTQAGITEAALLDENFEDMVNKRAETNKELGDARGGWEKATKNFEEAEKPVEDFIKADEEATKAEERAKEAEEKGEEGAEELRKAAEELRKAAEELRKPAAEALPKIEMAKDALSTAGKTYLDQIEKEFGLEEIYRLADNLEERGILRAAFPSVALKVHQEKVPEKTMADIISAIKPEQFPVTPMTTLQLDKEFMKEFILHAKSPHLDAFAHRFRITGQEVLEKTLMDLALEKKKPVSQYLEKENKEIHDYLSSWMGLRFVDLRTLDEKVEKILKIVGEGPKEGKEEK